MRVVVYPADAGGCGHYRLIWPARALVDDEDMQIVIHTPSDTSSPTIQAKLQETKYGTKVVGVEPINADVVVLQRPLRADLVGTIPFLRQQGIAVVVEVDDLFSAIDPQNKAWATVQGGYRNHYNLLKACAMADMVTVTTEELRKVYGFGKPQEQVRIIRNYVPTGYTQVPRHGESRERPVIGWTGSVETHPHDLQHMGGAVSAIVATQAADFVVVGEGTRVPRILGLPPTYEMRASGWVQIDEYPMSMSQLDIGVVPLDLTPFNEAKSWLKGLEFAALGIPFVASPTRPYWDLYRDFHIGYIAKTRKWLGPLRRLIVDGEHLDVGAEWRQAVIKHGLTIEDRAYEWKLAWKDAWTNRSKDQ
jgi:hypothetical protein